MKIFLDVGGYNGDTAQEALKHDYDLVHIFEPSRKHADALINLARSNTQVIRYHQSGLGLRNETVVLFDSGSDGASIYSDKPQPAKTGFHESINLLNTAQWFTKNISYKSTVHMKINVEGAELKILNALINSGEISKVDELLVYYDCVKIPKLGEPAANMMERKLDGIGILKNRVSIYRQKIVRGESLAKPYVCNWLKSINKKA